jgi:type 1 glutamine amidotransferase
MDTRCIAEYGITNMVRCVILALCLLGCSSQKTVLVLSKTAGWRHDSIETAVSTVQTICEEEGWNCIATEDSSQLIAQEYDAIVFLSTTGDILNEGEQNHLKKFIQKGGGFVGIHAAANTEEGWDWFNEHVLCAVFKRHDPVKPLIIDVVERNHPSTSHLEGTWPRVDEWYVYDRIPRNVTILLTVEDEDGLRPIAWCKEVNDGKSFYSGGGHTIEAWAEPLFIEHIKGGIEWAITP